MHRRCLLAWLSTMPDASAVSLNLCSCVCYLKGIKDPINILINYYKTVVAEKYILHSSALRPWLWVAVVNQ